MPSTTPGPPATPNTARLRDSSKATRVQPLTPQSRLDNILQEGRRRKLAMDANSASGPEAYLTTNVSSNTQDSERNGTGTNILTHAEAESSADEETHIVARGMTQPMNYQATQQRLGVANKKPSTASIRRAGRVIAQGDSGHGEDEADEQLGWWGRLLSEYGSIELENKGSVARDHLALERTFLAWLRTSLAFASIGIAITQLFRLNTASSSSGGGDPYRHLRQMGKPLGATFLGISIVMLGVGFHRYFESQHWIIRGKFPASRGSIALVAAITCALMITSLVVVVVVEPGSFEKR
ncbi:hypothetical protein BGZ60DRAFT_403089 [Tricladium varicosporioides]|nr:hypothetical protein BGZ60DRAFT_403089 [Hymenoscyphus varicosporioides]